MNRKKIIGFSLLECLLALGLITSAILVMSRIQQFNQFRIISAKQKALAQLQISHLLSRFNAVSAIDQRSLELAVWEKLTKSLLPGAKVVYDCLKPQCTVQLLWQQGSKSQRVSRRI